MWQRTCHFQNCYSKYWNGIWSYIIQIQPVVLGKKVTKIEKIGSPEKIEHTVPNSDILCKTIVQFSMPHIFLQLELHPVPTHLWQPEGRISTTSLRLQSKPEWASASALGS